MNSKTLLDEIVKNEFIILLNKYSIGEDDVIHCTYETGEKLMLPSSEYALMRGKEILFTCNFRGVKGQVFTVAPRFFHGTIGKVLELDLTRLENRSIFYATVNAVLRYLGVIKRSLHCSGHQPEECGRKLVKWITSRYGYNVRVLHIGYQPGHVRVLRRFLKDNLIVTDLSEELIGKRLYDKLLIVDGVVNDTLINYVDVVLATSSSIINKTFHDILLRSMLLNKELVLYGVSGMGFVALLKHYDIGSKIEVFCPYSL